MLDSALDFVSFLPLTVCLLSTRVLCSPFLLFPFPVFNSFLSDTMFSAARFAARRVAGSAMRTQTRALHASSAAQAKVVVALYPDPVTGYPPKYARDDIPEIKGYNDGQTAPTPQGIDFTPGELLGCVSGELGLRKYLESNGHTLVVTSDKYVFWLWLFLGYTQPCIICSHTLLLLQGW